MDQLLGFDERLYLAILAARSQLVGIIAVIVTFANFQGLVWWILGGALMRNRGGGRRGAWIGLTIAIGLGLSWAVAEMLKEIVRRPRPYLALVGAPPTLIDPPSSFSFPSGDAALAFGAAVALGQVLPRLRLFGLLLASAIALSRVVVGVHYPLDVLAGAVLGLAVATALRLSLARFAFRSGSRPAAAPIGRQPRER